MVRSGAWVYILKCCDNSYNTGSSSDIEVRLSQHVEGTFPGYTSKRLPVQLVFCTSFPTVREAVEAERQIKGWSRVKKEALIAGDYQGLHSLSQCRNQSHFVLSLLRSRNSTDQSGPG